MDAVAMWAAVAAERRALADLLNGLAEDQWDHPSLCSEWRVRDVAAHVALPPLSPSTGRILLRGLQARGNLQHVNRDLAVERAERPSAEIVEQLREIATSRRKPAITPLVNLHFDVLVHVQDVAVPLGFEHAMPIESARAGAEQVWRMGWPFWAKRTFRGLRLVASDTDWSVGSGPDVRGPIQSLLLLLTGRTAAATPHLTGSGADRLAA